MTTRSKETAIPQAGGAAMAEALGTFANRRILVAGDIMLDRFVYGAIDRISPEAPIPVLLRRSDTEMLGGAGNVAANVASLGAQVEVCTVVGDDAVGARVRERLSALGVDPEGPVAAPGRPTSCKSRFIALNQQVLRLDEEVTTPLEAAVRALLVERFTLALARCDVVILSDYGKGVLGDGVAGELIGLANAAGKRVVVDPKGRDYGIYRGADVITPNRKELSDAAGRDVHTDGEVQAAALDLITQCDLHAILATRSEKGMSVIRRESVTHIPTEARDVFDVSGAGDTVVAVLALGLAAGLDWDDAARLANAAAGIVVAKQGTAQASVEELRAALRRTYNAVAIGSAVLSWEDTQRLVAGWRSEGLRIGFTNGCFDLLHAGHVSLLQEARRRCDRLIVALNTDASVRRLKGEGRPVNTEADRAFVMGALACVDGVVLFDQDTPLELIERIRPDVLMKGADYRVEDVVGGEFVMAQGGEVVLIDLVEGRSTTRTIGRIRAAETSAQ